MKNRVKELRKNQKLTQEELAELIGISRQAINAIEKEKFDPSLPTAFKMASLFKTSGIFSINLTSINMKICIDITFLIEKNSLNNLVCFCIFLWDYS